MQGFAYCYSGSCYSSCSDSSCSCTHTTVLLLGQDNEDTTTEPDYFKLHVDPLDPIIMSVLTSDGDTIYMLRNETSDGLSKSIKLMNFTSKMKELLTL